jgi:hypothetical protein
LTVSAPALRGKVSTALVGIDHFLGVKRRGCDEIPAGERGKNDATAVVAKDRLDAPRLPSDSLPRRFYMQVELDDSAPFGLRWLVRRGLR